MSDIYTKGDILLVKGVFDLRKLNPKDRPVLVVEVASPDLYYGVAITSRIPRPLSEKHIRLPYARHGSCQTGLSKESWAICEWLIPFNTDDVIEKLGHLRSITLERVLLQLPHEN